MEPARGITSEQPAAVTDTQIERGQQRPVTDGIGWIVGISDRVMLWNRRIAKHNISPQSEQAIAAYLASNDLTTVPR